MDIDNFKVKKEKNIQKKTKRKISESNQGKHHTLESKLKMSLAKKDKIVSEETKQKMCESNMGKPHRYSSNRKNKNEQ